MVLYGGLDVAELFFEFDRHIVFAVSVAVFVAGSVASECEAFWSLLLVSSVSEALSSVLTSSSSPNDLAAALMWRGMHDSVLYEGLSFCMADWMWRSSFLNLIVT